jgi:pyridoxal 5'-phosphate synthase pdxS subunit
LAEMLKGGVIMDVVTAEQARIAEEAGAVAVMALERVPSDIRQAGGVARMADPTKIEEIQAAVTIPVMAKCRIGHFAEALVLQALGVDYIDESEVLTPADNEHHVDKWAFTTPFVCGARNLGEALRRIGEGAAMIRTKGEAGTGNVVEAVTHMRTVTGELRRLTQLGPEQLMAAARDLGAPYELVKEVHETGVLPVVNFAAGGIATPADAALMMGIGSRRGLRRLGNLQELRPPCLCPRHRGGDHVLERSRGRGQGVERTRRCHARTRDQQDPSPREAGGAGLVSPWRWSGCWGCKETFASI